jgi:hypothetical protein
MKKLAQVLVIAMAAMSFNSQAIILEGICFELLKVLSGHLFKGYLENRDEIKLHGAPSWYYQPLDDQHVCVYSTAKGDLDAVEASRTKTKQAMKEEITRIIKVVTEDQKKLVIVDDQDREIVEAFKFDSNIGDFVDQHLSIDRMDYRDKIDRAFTRGCIAKKDLIAYEEKRLEQLQLEIVDKRSSSAFKELESF